MTDLIMTVLAQNRRIKSVIKLGAKVLTYIVCYGLDSMILLTDRSC